MICYIIEDPTGRNYDDIFTDYEEAKSNLENAVANSTIKTLDMTRAQFSEILRDYLDQLSSNQEQLLPETKELIEADGLAHLLMDASLPKTTLNKTIDKFNELTS